MGWFDQSAMCFAKILIAWCIVKVIFVLYMKISCKTDPGLLFLSCISWSSYHKNLLASSDYEGTVILWDGFTGQRSKVYQVTHNHCEQHFLCWESSPESEVLLLVQQKAFLFHRMKWMFLLFGKCISSTQLYWAVVLQGRRLVFLSQLWGSWCFLAAAFRQGICTERNEFLEAVSPFFRSLCLSIAVPLQSLWKAFCETLWWLPAQVLVEHKCKMEMWVVRLGQGSTRHNKGVPSPHSVLSSTARPASGDISGILCLVKLKHCLSNGFWEAPDQNKEAGRELLCLGRSWKCCRLLCR